MKKTPWFPAHIKPVRKGRYEVAFTTGGSAEAVWTGEAWVWPPEFEVYYESRKLMFQERRWRGLAENPNERT